MNWILISLLMYCAGFITHMAWKDEQHGTEK